METAYTCFIVVYLIFWAWKYISVSRLGESYRTLNMIAQNTVRADAKTGGRTATGKKNRLYYGDNLDVLRQKIVTESVDLCYIDPPFNSKRTYFQIYNNLGGEDRAQTEVFADTWEWGDEAATDLAYITNVVNLQNATFTEQTVELIRGLHKVLKIEDL
jgi:hypothetical protein